MIRQILGTTALATVLAAAMPAMGQQLDFSSTTVFGDSLSDTGNLVPLGLFPGAPYVDGRFTSAGGVWVDYFDDITGIPATSRAFGGARSIRTLPIDLTAQVDAYLAGGPTIARDQLFALWIGGNDYLALLESPTAPSTAQATATITGVATSVGTQAGRLRAAGAQNFLLFNLPPLGQIPATSGAGADARNSANQLSSLHAAAMSGVAQNLRASGATVVIVDIETLFRDQLARPEVYGFSNVTVPCYVPNAADVLVATGACATEAGLQGSVFFDPVHPTSAAHRLIAQFANGSMVTSLVGPQALAAATQLSLGMFELGTDAIAGRMAGARTGSNNVGIQAVQAGADARWGIYTFGTWATADSDAFDGQLGYEQDAWNAGLGLDYQIDQHLTVGLAASYGDGEMDLDDGAGTIDTKSYGLTAYATMATGGLWADAFMGYSFDDLGVSRSTGFAPLPVGEGDTNAHTYGVGFTTGYSFGVGSFGFGPLAELRYARVEMDGYQEDQAGPLALEVGRMEAESFEGKLGVQASGRFGSDALAIVPSLELAWEHEFYNDDREVRAILPGGDVVRSVAGAGDRDRAVVGAGLAVEASDGLMAAVGYRGAVSGGNGDDHAFTARIRVTY